MPNMQEAIEKAIQIFGLQLLMDKDDLIFMLEDLVPYLQDDLAYIEKMYSLEVGRILFEKWNASVKSEYTFSDVKLFLSENEGFNDKWIKKFISFFDGLNLAQYVKGSLLSEENNSQIVDDSRRENLRIQGQFEEKWKEILRKAILKKNQLFFQPEIPEKKLVKLLNRQKSLDITREQVIAVLLYDNGIWGSDGIVLSEYYMLEVCPKETIGIPIADIKDVKTYLLGKGVAIKVLLNDGTIIPTSISSEKYNISAIMEYLQGAMKNVDDKNGKYNYIRK